MKATLHLKTKIVLIFTTIVSITYLIVDVVQWDLINRDTVFGIAYQILFAYVILVFTVVFTFLFFLWVRIKYRQWEAVVPFAIAFTVLLITIAGVPATIAQYLNFYRNYNARMGVVKKIEAGELHKINNDAIRLPSKYKYLSSDNEVLVKGDGDNIMILFFFFNQFGGYSGFVYSKNNTAPSSRNYFRLGDPDSVNNIKSHWYLVSGE